MFAAPNTAAGTAGAGLTTAFSSDMGVYVELDATEEYAEALDALCNRRAAAVTLDAFNYLIASREGCGQAVYVAQRDGATATQGQFIALDLFLPELFGGVFCRPGPDSLNGWVIPYLTLRSRGLDPLTGFYDIVDAGSDEEVVRLVDSGKCGMGAAAFGAEAGVPDLRNRQRLQILAGGGLTPVSNEVVVVSSLVDPAIQVSMLDAVAAHLPEIAALLDANQLILTEDAAFDELRALFASSGIDPESLAQ